MCSLGTNALSGRERCGCVCARGAGVRARRRLGLVLGCFQWPVCVRRSQPFGVCASDVCKIQMEVEGCVCACECACERVCACTRKCVCTIQIKAESVTPSQLSVWYPQQLKEECGYVPCYSDLRDCETTGTGSMPLGSPEGSINKKERQTCSRRTRSNLSVTHQSHFHTFRFLMRVLFVCIFKRSPTRTSHCLAYMLANTCAHVQCVHMQMQIPMPPRHRSVLKKKTDYTEEE